MDWQKILGDMVVLSEKPVSEGVLMFAMYLDLYKSTTNPELKKVLELMFIKMTKGAGLL